MSFLFKTPSVQAPAPVPPPPPAPTIDQARTVQDQNDLRRMRRGSASTILVPDTGPSTARTILGG